MGRQEAERNTGQAGKRNPTEELRALSRQVLQTANSELTRTYFLRKVLRIVSNYFRADEIRMLLRDPTDPSRNEFVQFTGEKFRYNLIPGNGPRELDKHWRYMLSGRTDPSLPFITEGGSLWILDIDNPGSGMDILDRLNIPGYLESGKYSSLLLTPFTQDKKRIGLLELNSRDSNFLSGCRIDSLETFIQTLGITLLNQHTQAALRERVKELSCLYSMSQIADKPSVSLEDLMHSIMDLIPPAWQYPEITRSRITMDGIEYALPGFRPDADKLSSDIEIDGKLRGSIDVIYTSKRSTLDEGPFLKEERKLLDVIAKELAHILKRRESEDDKAKLLNQLHHADRLATVGELAAGVAHEINEPLGSILGFAQLASKYPDGPAQVKKDLEKIVNASLHAREIVKKMMVFSRHVSSEKKEINFNQVLDDSLYLIKSRCSKEGIDLMLSLDPLIPPIIADPVQINQVVLNIVVNAIQAMPGGGTLSIQTAFRGNEIELRIRDSGQGMSEEVRRQIFNPFFTTKGAGVGLGLGLSVVDGIIKSHGGRIEVRSQPGKGTEFIIGLPAGTGSQTNSNE